MALFLYLVSSFFSLLHSPAIIRCEAKMDSVFYYHASGITGQLSEAVFGDITEDDLSGTQKKRTASGKVNAEGVLFFLPLLSHSFPEYLFQQSGNASSLQVPLYLRIRNLRI